MSRKNRLANVDVFDSTSVETDSLTFQEVDQTLFGSGRLPDKGREVIKPIRIMEIYPDPTQPRRVIPSVVRSHWTGSPESLTQVFGEWLQKIFEESDQEFDLAAHLHWKSQAGAGEAARVEAEDISAAQPVGPVETAFREIVELAASIRRDGLTNPITVARSGRHFQLETGERRWLAYHLLYRYFDGSDGRPDERSRWETIPAREVDKVDVWRQATENTARANLNAIGRARQFAILLMDLWTNEERKSVAFKGLDEFESDRLFYAQVADVGIPYGKGDQLLNAMGLSHRSAFTRCRKLLSLPDEVWTIGDDANLAEDILLKLADMESEKAVEQAHKIVQIVASRNNLENANLSQDSPTPPEESLAADEIPLITREDRRIINKAVGLMSRVGRSALSQMKPAQKRDILELAHYLRLMADSIEDAVTSK